VDVSTPGRAKPSTDLGLWLMGTPYPTLYLSLYRSRSPRLPAAETTRFDPK